LLIGSLRTTSVMAMVVDARAFGTNPRRTNLREHAITLADRIALGLLIGLTLSVILLLVFNIGNRPI
jgi:energy-coupling factor transport system permease protein